MTSLMKALTVAAALILGAVPVALAQSSGGTSTGGTSGGTSGGASGGGQGTSGGGG